MPEGTVPAAVRNVAAELAEPKPMRRGSVSERSMKCGRKECHCQEDPQARHGQDEEARKRVGYVEDNRARMHYAETCEPRGG